MDLKLAVKRVLEDTLENHQGGIPYEYLKHLDKNIFVEEMLKNNHFLGDFTASLEMLVADTIEKYGDEFDKELQ